MSRADRWQRVCVFCGSSRGVDGRYRRAAETLGKLLAEEGVTLVYGGGSVGLMGVLADAALGAGGRVIGVIPEAMVFRELAHPGLTELRVTPDLHARKALMAGLAEAFVALPGGFGTMEELLEMITWNQLGIHAKPVGLLNVGGYYEPLMRLVDRAVADGFISRENRDAIAIAEEPDLLLDRMARKRTAGGGR